MAWDYPVNPAITRARLLVSSPTDVCAALKDYDAYIKEWTYGYDEELEKILLERNDPLINITLAKVAASEYVIKYLWNEANTPSPSNMPDSYRQGLRLAILSGNGAYQISQDKNNLLKLLIEDEEGAIELVRNPRAPGVLRGLFTDEPPFDQIGSERKALLVSSAADNPLLNVDTSNEDGPDLLAWDIQKGIPKMLNTAPLNKEWFIALRKVLMQLDPYRAQIPDFDIREVLNRWGSVKLKDEYSKEKDADEEGWWTLLSAVNEFCCQIAALYGRRLDFNMEKPESAKFIMLGSADNPDVVMRCAFYGNATLTPEQMQIGYDRDREVFTFAALSNDGVFTDPEKRSLLEKMLARVGPRSQESRYLQRCKQVHDRIPEFDPEPVGEPGTLSVIGEKPISDEMKTIQSLNAEVRRISKLIGQLGTGFKWGLLVIAALVIWLR